MGASNFYNKNASKVFVVLDDYETPILDEEGNETEEMETIRPEEWEIKEFDDNIRELAKEKFPNEFTSLDHSDGCRNYPARYLFALGVPKEIGGVDVCIEILASRRSGYYLAANLDWDLTISIGNGWEWDQGPDIVDITEAFSYESQYKGLHTKHAQIASNWLEKTEKELIEKLEGFFAQHSETYKVFAKFSNGETMYEKSN